MYCMCRHVSCIVLSAVPIMHSSVQRALVPITVSASRLMQAACRMRVPCYGGSGTVSLLTVDLNGWQIILILCSYAVCKAT